MNRVMYFLLMIGTVVAVSKPVYGKESSLCIQGNVIGVEEQIAYMKEDYLYLKEEVNRLLDECY